MTRKILIEIEADEHGHEHTEVSISGDGIEGMKHHEIGDYICKRLAVALGRSIASIYKGRDIAIKAATKYSMDMVAEIAEGHKVQRKGS